MKRFSVILAVVFTFSVGSLSYAQQLGIWTSTKEIADIPMTGCAWDKMKNAADSANPGLTTVSDQSSNNNVQILAAAIVYSRTGRKFHKNKVVAALEKLVSEGRPAGRTLGWARETAAYVMAADLVGYRTAAFEQWCRNIAEVWIARDGRTMLQMFKRRPNNWGSHAFASLTAIYSYLQDNTRLKEIRDYWIQTVIGPKPDETRYGGDLSWHIDENNLRLINPVGSKKEGMNIDGIIPDDMRRGSGFRYPPQYTGYPWEHLQGIVVASRVLNRMGMSIWEVDNRAIYRAAYALQVRLENSYGEWKAKGDDEWLLPFMDKAFGTNWSKAYDPCSSRVYKHGKNAGWGWIILK